MKAMEILQTHETFFVFQNRKAQVTRATQLTHPHFDQTHKTEALTDQTFSLCLLISKWH